MVANLEILQEYINRNSTNQGDHVVWNQSVQQRLTIHNLAKEVGLSKKIFRPYELFWVLENKKEMMSNTKLEKTCQTNDCIIHYNVIQFNIDAIVEMDVNTYVKNCERFDKYCELDTQTNCINWTGDIDKNGYGRIGFLGKHRGAHCVSYMLANCEDIPEGQVVRHLCPKKNKLCVNPDHLTIGTHQQNAQDEVDAGNIPQGEKNQNATISNELVQKIIDSFGNKKTTKERAKEFGVTRGIIACIDAAKSWRSLMTLEQISEREGVERQKRNMEVLSDDIILQIKNSSESFAKCAKTYTVTTSIVKKIRDGRYKSLPERDEIGFKKAIEKLSKKSTEFKDDFGVEHLLFKDDKSQDPNAKRYQISYFGIFEYVHRASYMAHHKIKSIEQEKMVRHKCLYKHCINNECLELGTAQDNANDRKRDNTNQKGEQHHSAKITQEIATQIKQTKGIGTRQQRSEFFKVSTGIISNIDNHKTWTHVKDAEIDDEVINKLKQYITSQPITKKARLC
jgi:hypothetical protein